jgi:hypothetical protein
VNDEIDTFARADSDLEQSCGEVGADERGQIVEQQYAYRVLIGVEDVVVGDTVLAGAGEDDRIHDVNLS